MPYRLLTWVLREKQSRTGGFCAATRAGLDFEPIALQKKNWLACIVTSTRRCTNGSQVDVCEPPEGTWKLSDDSSFLDVCWTWAAPPELFSIARLNTASTLLALNHRARCAPKLNKSFSDAERFFAAVYKALPCL